MNVDLATTKFAAAERASSELLASAQNARRAAGAKAIVLERAKRAVIAADMAAATANFELLTVTRQYDAAVKEVEVARKALDAAKAMAPQINRPSVASLPSPPPFKTEAKLQDAIRRAVGTLFEVEKEASPPWLVNPVTGRSLRFDVYIPAFKIAIECDGEQHFKDTDFYGKPSYVADVVKLDATKACLCYANNVKLIRIQRQMIAAADTEWMDELGGVIKSHLVNPGESLPAYIYKSPSPYGRHVDATRELWKARRW